MIVIAEKISNALSGIGVPEQYIGSGIIKFVLLAVFVAIIISVFKNIKRKINRSIYRAKRQIFGGSGYIGSSIENQLFHEVSRNIPDIISGIKEAQEIPEIKSVGGMTSIYLKKISSDFPDFHSPDAEDDIKTFIVEYLNIVYRNQEGFVKSGINNNLIINLNKRDKSVINNIKFNGISIYGYTKTLDYATITYRVSVGYNTDSGRKEERYELKYTYRLKENNLDTKSMRCSNCGGSLETAVDGVCPYCGTVFVKDTIMNWIVSDIRSC